MKMKTVYGVLFVVLLILLVAFVYSPHEDEAILQRPNMVDTLYIDSGHSTLALPVNEITAYPDPNPYVQQVVNSYEDFIRQAIKRGTAPGAAVAIVRDTSIIFLQVFWERHFCF